MKHFPFILLFFILYACKPPEDVKVSCTNNTMYLPQMAKDYFLFKEGTYWIYENQATKEIDSLYVCYFHNYTGNNAVLGSIKLNKCFENYQYSIYTNNSRVLSKNVAPWGPTNWRNFENQLFFVEEYNTITNTIYEIVHFEGDSIKNSTVLDNKLFFKDSILIKNTIFKNVIQIQNNVIGLDTKHMALYAKNIGLIEYITFDNQEYDLIRYHIEQ